MGDGDDLPAAFHNLTQLALELLDRLTVHPAKIRMLTQPMPCLDGGDLAIEINAR